MIVGTEGGEIYEINLQWKYLDPQLAPLVTSHPNGELWGLDVSSKYNYYFTAGDDGSVRIWFLSSHQCLGRHTTKFKEKDTEEKDAKKGQQKGKTFLSRCIAVNDSFGLTNSIFPSEFWLLIGIGGDLGRGVAKERRGGHQVLRCYPSEEENHQNKSTEEKWEFKIIAEEILNSKNSSSWVSDVKWRPNPEQDKSKDVNNLIYAVGSHDNNIYVYSLEVQHKMDKESKCPKLLFSLKGHNSYITHIDFSEDGNFLQSNCGAYELLFWDTEITNPENPQPDSSSKKRLKSSRHTRDVKFSTFTCTLGWPVQAIWPDAADGTDINTVDRGDLIKEENPQTLVATGGDDGKVRIFHYPCITRGAKYIEGIGHSSHVTKVKFIKEKSMDRRHEKKRIISTGGGDKCIFQWHLIDR